MADQDQERLKGGMGQQSPEPDPAAAGSGDGAQQAVGSALQDNDQAGGGLGQNHSGYGSGTTHDATGGQGHGEVTQGAQGQTGHLGPAPGGAGQPRSNVTGGPDLSKGLADGNKNGGGI